MPLVRRLITTAVAAASLLTVACAHGFELRRYAGNNERLYAASLEEFRRHRWENAVTGFERLSTELSARDTLLPRAYYYLASAHSHRQEHLLAAQSYTRLVESFPDDTLADDALLAAGRSYQRLWRKPALDPQYGTQAIATFRTLLSNYPTSPLRDQATRRIAELEQWLATKDYDSGMHYFRRKAFDSAIIYFKDVVRGYPETPRARDAYLRLHDAYRRIRYTEDAREVCDTLRQRYPADRDVRRTCGAPAATATAPTPPTP
jgi:outer membrane protein assembly factor BamD